jgi:hypothetical protein
MRQGACMAVSTNCSITQAWVLLRSVRCWRPGHPTPTPCRARLHRVSSMTVPLVAIDEILRALKSLDAGDMRIPEHGKRAAFWQAPFERRRGWTSRTWARIVRRRRSDDDDDPPPCPAYAATPPKRGGGAASAYREVALAYGGSAKCSVHLPTNAAPNH